MPPAHASVAADPPPTAAAAPDELLGAYLAHLARSGRGNIAYQRAARAFLTRWPAPQAWAALPLAERLAASKQTRPFVTFLMVGGWLQPGYDYLVCRKLSSIWREVTRGPLGADLDRFMAAAAELGFSQRVRVGIASQIVARLLIQTGRPLHELTAADLAALASACRQRGRGWRSYRGALHGAHRVLFHLGILAEPPPPHHTRDPLEARMADVAAPLRASFVAYLERKRVTCTATRSAAWRPGWRPLGASSRRPTRPWHRWPSWTGAATSSHTWSRSARRPTGTARGCRLPNRPDGPTRWRVCCPTSPSGAGRRRLPGGCYFAPTSPANPNRCHATCRRMPTGGLARRSSRPRRPAGWPPTPACCSVPAGLGSANCWTSNSTASTRSQARAPG